MLISTSKNVYIDKLYDIMNKYSNTYHRTIKLKTVDVTSSTYIDFNEKNNKEGPKFKVDHNVRISRYKNIFAKVYVPNWSGEIFVIKKIKDTVSWTYIISDLNVEEIFGTFYEKELQIINHKEFRVQKLIKKKSNKLYVIRKAMIVLLIVGLIKKT